MPLKFKFKTKDEIPADHLPLYAEREGGWILDVEGAVDKSKLDEFRHTNVSLLKERDDLKKRYEGIDPEEVAQGRFRQIASTHAFRQAGCPCHLFRIRTSAHAE